MTTATETETGWQAVFIERGTSYLDEPSVTIDPGWYVQYASGHVHLDADAAAATIHVEQAFTADGTDITEQLAHQIADLLNTTPLRQMCPSCASPATADALPGIIHACPKCACEWALPRGADGPPATGWSGLWQRIKVAMTSRPFAARL